MSVDVLIVGGGGREHSLAWKLKRSPRLGKLYIAPGNGGTRALGENVPIQVMDFEGLAKFAAEKKIGLTVVGPDDPLAGGIVDLFEKRGLRIFGPSKAAAQLEASKSFAKKLMTEGKIPTAAYRVFSSHAQARMYLKGAKLPVVVKASGLALGKGVYVCKTFEEAEIALEKIMLDRVHGDAGLEVVVEEYIEGEEVSIHALSDGIEFVMFPPSQDHKRALDNDEGENTGGMGAYAPVPWADDVFMGHVGQSVVSAALDTLRSHGVQYKGLLYPGIMATTNGPRVLEFNARFGDPECQVYMRLLKSDLLDLLEASVDGTLYAIRDSIEWYHGHAVNLVLASGGYPGPYQKGFPIEGIEQAEALPNVVVFHAGTGFDGRLVTTGGRVLGISVLAPTLQEAVSRAYEAAELIRFEGMHYRKDIAQRAVHFFASNFA
jgi:phosphoribosylamine--glycine ligase